MTRSKSSHKRKKPVGWEGEPRRHADAARGIPTAKPKRGKRRFAVTLVRVDADKPWERKDVEIEARHMDTAAKRAEKEASDEAQKWKHIRIREL